MKLLNRLAKPLHQLVFGLLTVIPLLTVMPAVQAADQPEVAFSQAELDQMLAPIALYPDALLSQVLIASTYPLEIIQADRWVRSNKDLKTEDALKFAENKDWDPSVKALVAFPDILHRLSDDVDWTQRLGDAFLSNEDQVMDSVQRLRKRAYATGNLEKAQHITVEQDDNNIIIEPREERVVYVPVYDTRVVYGNWWWPHYPPVYWHYPSNYTYVSGFYWGTSIYLGPTYFYSSCHWRDRRVVVIDRHHHYGGNTRFYTGRSIVRHEGSRQWRHDPAHRHGVAYYNNNLRETYDSRRESHQSDRNYREQHRDMSRLNRDNNNRNDSPKLRDFGRGNDANTKGNDRRRPETNNTATNNSRPFDRSEQVRERLNRNENGNGQARPPQGNGNNNISVQNTNITTSGIRTPIQVPETRNDNSPELGRNNGNERNREMIQRRQVSDANREDQARVNQERRVVTEDARPSFVNPSPRAAEQRTESAPAPQPRIERQETRRAEYTPPQRAEGRGAEQRSERHINNPRGGRERQSDETR